MKHLGQRGHMTELLLCVAGIAVLFTLVVTVGVPQYRIYKTKNVMIRDLMTAHACVEAFRKKAGMLPTTIDAALTGCGEIDTNTLIAIRSGDGSYDLFSNDRNELVNSEYRIRSGDPRVSSRNKYVPNAPFVQVE